MYVIRDWGLKLTSWAPRGYMYMYMLWEMVGVGRSATICGGTCVIFLCKHRHNIILGKFWKIPQSVSSVIHGNI